VLTGPDPDSDGSRHKVYVGEGDSVRTRLDQHHKEKEFWNRGFIFTSKDESLNKAHVRYLEAALLRLAQQTRSAMLDNGTLPEVRGLSEAERDDMESYLDEVLILLPLLGVQAFSPVRVKREPPTVVDEMLGLDSPTLPTAEPLIETRNVSDGPVASASRESVRYLLKERGKGLNAVAVQADARDTPRGFVVLEGSTGPAKDQTMSAGYALLRRRLRDDGSLVPTAEPLIMRLSRDVIFDSPSAAATVMTGSNRNGMKCWRDETGSTLAQNRASSVE
jgi:hypothetical protein